MIITQIHDITKSFGGNIIFENLSAEIHEKDRIGLVGRNGSGKTTLFQLLAGVEAPDSGMIHIKKGLRVGYLAQIPVFSAGTTVREVLETAFSEVKQLERNMKRLEEQMGSETEELEKLLEEYGKVQERYLFLGGYEVEAQLAKVCSGLQITSLLPQVFTMLSGGEQTKVCLALMLLQNPDLLLLDEPTNHLDIGAVEWLEQFLQEYSGTIAIISHDRYFLDAVVTKIIDLEDGELHVYHTNYSGFVKEKQERLLLEFQAYEEQQKKIKKMKEAIKRLREWANQANPPNEGLHRRARNMERALERMEKLKRPILEHKKMGLAFRQGERSGKDVVRVEDVAKSFGNKMLFCGANLHLQFQERAAIVGQNGSGKTTLVKMLLGEETPDTGKIQIGGSVKVGYLSQHLPGSTNNTVLGAFREQVSVTEGEARHILAGFLFYGFSVFKKTNQLSGGERMRLRLAQLMHQDVNFLILDEPTNHLDIESREVLEEALEDYEGTILAISHDRYFLNKLFDKTYWIQNGVLHGFAGNYEWARKKLAERMPVEEKVVVPKRVVKVKEASTDVEWRQLERELEQMEEQLFVLEEKMTQEVDLHELQTLQKEKDELEEKRAMVYEELERLL
ncbi:ABC-F type ribosomal protection protein [Ectobacillus sp. JY-23]|uniref:ribosomal protection-like ABC-F family protein n=1 Tax=Ectobacillus sp. JY-23 TaxID=2933872 RepID=UPI001FF5A286|nr:ABC-F type ribosomal protection protein [Ectobacillus sp. JY-23]UOY91535.1 ABC-F type ribosomal protection protein [Ectobacillus sp. JY-23]